MNINEINGYKVLTHNNNSKLCTVQVVVNAGSHNETSEDLWGAAHYLEHMTFKGTEFHHYKDINEKAARLGYINAYTYEDKTTYFISCLASKAKESIDLLMEMFFYPKFDEAEFNKEKTVILEEMSINIDNPNDYFWATVYEKFRNSHWIVGTKESIGNMTVDKLKKFRKDNYTKGNILFTVIGGIDEDEINKHFKIGFNTIDEMIVRCPELDVCNLNETDMNEDSNLIMLESNSTDCTITHNSSQAYFAMVTEGMSNSVNSENNYVQSLFTSILGGGVHSLLFQRIREELGYCYSTGAFCQTFSSNNGNFCVYAVLDKANVKHTCEEIAKIIEDVKANGVSGDLIRTAKDSLIYGLTTVYDTSGGLSDVTKNYFKENKVTWLDEIVEKIESLTNDDIKKYANDYMKNFKIVTMMK